MPRPTIDYLNERRAAKPASGGKDYSRSRNATDDRAQFAGLDRWEQAMLEVAAIFADFRKDMAEPPACTLDDTF